MSDHGQSLIATQSRTCLDVQNSIHQTIGADGRPVTRNVPAPGDPDLPPRAHMGEEPLQSGDTAWTTDQSRVDPNRHHGRVLDGFAPERFKGINAVAGKMSGICLLYTSPSPRDQRGSRMPSSA